MRSIEDIRKSAADAKLRAAKVLTPEQEELAAALAEETDAKEALALEEAKLRALDMHGRTEAAAAKAGGAHLVAGVDLVALFPAGKAPPAGQLPGGGVLIVRSPPPVAIDALNRDVEHKQKPLSAILIDLLMASTVDPAPDGADGIKLREFAERYPDAAGQAAQKARELGGAKSAADKRGRG